ncbi:unnamed protein product [Calicophoron daubneyi]|uniref:General transcription factor IIH subunit 4 n=1 Tax=Calicophoron daubneyi TaxID=300641 RepID=A0AAV2TTR4_CALDB
MTAHRSSIFDYLRNVDILMMDGLYTHPPTCLLIFRELPELAKHIVVRLLFIEQPIPKSVISGWVEKSSQSLLTDACKALSDLRLWHSVDGSVARGSWCLNKKYQESLRIALFGGGLPLLGDMGSSAVDKNSKSVEFLESYATERWEVVGYQSFMGHLGIQTAFKTVQPNIQDAKSENKSKFCQSH